METQLQERRNQYKLYNRIFVIWLVHTAEKAGYAFDNNDGVVEVAEYILMANRIVEKGRKVPRNEWLMLEGTISVRKEVNE